MQEEQEDEVMVPLAKQNMPLVDSCNHTRITLPPSLPVDIWMMVVDYIQPQSADSLCMRLASRMWYDVLINKKGHTPKVNVRLSMPHDVGHILFFMPSIDDGTSNIRYKLAVSAARRGFLDNLICLLREKDKYMREECLVHAAGQGHLEVVKYLCQNGADVTAQDNEAIVKAAQSGFLDVVFYLVKSAISERNTDI